MCVCVCVCVCVNGIISIFISQKMLSKNLTYAI